MGVCGCEYMYAFEVWFVCIPSHPILDLFSYAPAIHVHLSHRSTQLASATSTFKSCSSLPATLTDTTSFSSTLTTTLRTSLIFSASLRATVSCYLVSSYVISLCTCYTITSKVMKSDKMGDSSRGSPHTSQISHLLLYPSLWLLVPGLSSQFCHTFLYNLLLRTPLASQ